MNSNVVTAWANAAGSSWRSQQALGGRTTSVRKTAMTSARHPASSNAVKLTALMTVDPVDNSTAPHRICT